MTDNQHEQRHFCQTQLSEIDAELEQVDFAMEQLLRKQSFLEGQKANWLGRIAQLEGETPHSAPHLRLVQ